MTTKSNAGVTGLSRRAPSWVLLLTCCWWMLQGCAGLSRHAGVRSGAPRAVLNLDPGPGNPRNSEGDFLTLQDGRILFVYSHFTGSSASDFAHGYLASRYSADGGNTWSREDKVEVGPEGKMNVMSVSLLRLRDHRIALFYLRKNSREDCVPMMRLSSDEARTWGPAIRCIPREGYYVLNNSRVIQLAGGRILVPVAQHYAKGDRQRSASGKLYCYYSDDDGATWHTGGEVPNPGHVFTQEPGVVALGKGKVLMYIRTDRGVQYYALSEDDGGHWGDIYPGPLASPVSPASIRTIPATGDLLAVWNDNDGSDPDIRGKRTPLTLAVSSDAGRSWKHVKNIENDPGGWYCYTAICFVKRRVLLGYCAGDTTTASCLARTRITSVGLDWIYR
jgi:hypothetical protein